MSRQQSFATLLRWWRRHRALSQLELASRADISQRHLSFLELGRASPSSEMVSRLAAALDVPLPSLPCISAKATPSCACSRPSRRSGHHGAGVPYRMLFPDR
jgi:transcriptional regulator with XRE-family HTH domain